MKQKIAFLAVALLMTVAVMAERQTVKLRVPEMECANCQAKVEKVLAYEKGVKDLTFDLNKRIVTVVYDDTKTNVENLQNALVSQLKYKSKVLGDAGSAATTDTEKKTCSSTCTGHHHDQATDSTSNTHKTGCSSSCGHKH